MSYAIIGFGKIGQALARAFARKNVEVTVAGRRPPEMLMQQAQAIGSTIKPAPLQDAIASDTIFLAVPFWEHREVAKQMKSWHGKTIIDVTNTNAPVEDLHGLPSSAVVAEAFADAKFVKGFNHLPAAVLASDPSINGGNRVVFLSSDDENAVAPVAVLAEQLGFAPISLGSLHAGGLLVQARGDSWGELIFEDLVKFK